MHVFFEPVWKLHIGEIPARPDAATASIRSQMDYAAAIAAIKQNALTVGNPEFLESHFWCGKFEHLNLIEIPPPPDKFYFWPGGYETKEIKDGEIRITAGGHPFLGSKTVAILTLPEEKKNTMENIDEQIAKILRDNITFSGQVGDYVVHGAIEKIKELFAASGSVAAPKEEVTLGVGDGSGQHFVSGSYDTIKLLQGKLIELESYRLSYTFEEDGETGLSLLDRLTPPGDSDISRGRDEIQLLAEEIELHYSKELACLRQQLKEREEALKELLSLAVRYKNTVNFTTREDEFDRTQAIIERARKLISK